MSDFLTINGWAVPVKNAGAQRAAPKAIGPNAGRSTKGQLRRGERGWIFPGGMLRTNLFDPDTADALEALLLGEFWHFPFDLANGLYSEGGALGPLSGYTAALISSAPTPKFGDCALRVNSSGGSVLWQFTDVYSWTMSWWHNWNNSSPGADSWTHYVVVYDAAAAQYTVYTNGAVSYGPSGTPPTSPGNFSASLSGTTLTAGLLGKKTDGTSTTTAYFDDLVVARFAWPAALVSAIYNSGTGRAWSREPFVDVDGEIMNGMGPMEMSAMVENTEYVQASDDGTWTMNMREVAFNLEPRSKR